MKIFNDVKNMNEKNKMKIFNDVKNMNEKYKIEINDNRRLSRDDFLFRVKAMNEEIIEFQEAWLNNDKPGQIDAIIDLIIFASGSLWKMGITNEQFEKSWDSIMKANFNKKIVKNKKDSKRNYSFDLIKPKNWKDPKNTIKEILKEKNE